MIKIIKTHIQQLFNSLLRAYVWIKSVDKSFIRIEEIDASSQEMVIYSPGMRTVLRLSIAEAIDDPNILCRLSPVQACWLGYYSSMSPEEGRGLLSERKGVMLRFKKGIFKIASLDRKGRVSYINTHTNTVSTESPLFIAQDEDLLNNFDPSQACYIGILAGLERSKTKHQPQSGYTQPKLRLVQ